ncbi:Imm1 family immunity protein [Streptomyces sp. STR69]|uniref:Imm1 family immunity protein n=1 Tax=Streptomyces sp. STR69 TaxID=1796942 RepID=UPI0021C5BED2|nr:Imm1 family immunity protein [Streptomyces sp. STR69]
MVLNVLFSKEWRHAESEVDRSRLVAEVMENLRFEDSSSKWVSPGEDAWFCFSDHRFESVTVQNNPNTYLRVAVNRPTGYGALMWFATDRRTGRSEIFDYTWLSDNPEPPDFDPRVVADPGYPLFHHPRSTIPLDSVRLVLEEFCRTSSGERPQCIQWVQGELNGQRLGEEPVVDFVDTSDVTDPWA